MRGVLAVTGDPLPSDAPADLKGVFSYHSAVLARYIRDFSALHVYGALNVNARNFARELELSLIHICLCCLASTQCGFWSVQRSCFSCRQASQCVKRALPAQRIPVTF